MKKLFLTALAIVASVAASFASADDASNVRARVAVSEFGYDPDDSTEFIQKAIDSGARTVVLDRQSGPWIARPLTLRSDLELVLAEGVELQAKKGEFIGGSDVLLKAPCAKNLTIRGEGAGATIRMRKRDYWSAPYKLAEWRHGISLLSAENVLIENLTIAETGGDGIYVGVASSESGPCRNVTIRKVDCVENNRQGISVISVDGLLIEDSVLRDTNGTAPEAGIDFEPNRAAEQITNVVMRNVVSSNNKGDGFAFYLPNLENAGPELSFVLDGCKAYCNSARGMSLTLANGENRTLPGKMVVRDSEFLGNRVGIAIRSKWSAGAPLIFENVKITTPSALIGSRSDYPERLKDWTTTVDSGLSLIAVGTDADANGGMEFNNVEIADAGGDGVPEFLVTLRDASSEGVGFEKISGTIVSTTTSTGKRTTTRLDDKSIRELFPELNARRVPAFDLTSLFGASGASSAISTELASAWRARAAEKGAPSAVFRARGGCDYLFYAEEGEDVSWTFRQRKIGNYPTPNVNVSITEPDGNKIELESMEANFEPSKYSYRAPTTGWRRISANFGASSLELTDATTPILTVARPSLDVFSSSGRFEFYVPKETDDLSIRIVGSATERVTVVIRDPSNAVVATLKDVSALGAWSAPTDAAGQPIKPASGFWSLEFERPTIGVLEDYIVSIFGAPALLR